MTSKAPSNPNHLMAVEKEEAVQSPQQRQRKESQWIPIPYSALLSHAALLRLLNRLCLDPGVFLTLPFQCSPPCHSGGVRQQLAGGVAAIWAQPTLEFALFLLSLKPVTVTYSKITSSSSS